MIEAQIEVIVKAHVGLTALVGARVYPQVMPENGKLPAIIYQVISSIPITTHDGDANLSTTLVQFNCHAATYLASKQVAVQLRSCFSGIASRSNDVHSSIMKSSRDLYDAALKARGVSMDFLFTHEN